MTDGKIYVTKYVLSSGILVGVKDESRTSSSDNGVSVKWRGALNDSAYFYGKDWHENEAAARARAKKMIEAKLRSLDKQRAALVKLLETGVPMKDIQLPSDTSEGEGP